ncbi:hypothetical protein U713_05880 [Rhodobacter capsulatus YW2]|nr:hypothetical protein U713_05880 [Rhodobacter capsulatus YW2]
MEAKGSQTSVQVSLAILITLMFYLVILTSHMDNLTR